MSFRFPGPDGPAGRPSAPQRLQIRRPRLLLPVALIVLAILIVGGLFVSFYTDLLWYQSIGFSTVFITELTTKALLFVVFGLLMAGAVGGNLILAYRLRPPFRPRSLEQESLERYRDGVEPHLKALVIGVCVVFGLLRRRLGVGGVAHLAAVAQRHVVRRTRTRSSAATCRSSRSPTRSSGSCSGFAFAIVRGARWSPLCSRTTCTAASACRARATRSPRPRRAHISVAARRVRAAQGGRLLARPLRAGLLANAGSDHRPVVHRRERGAAGEDDPRRSSR